VVGDAAAKADHLTPGCGGRFAAKEGHAMDGNSQEVKNALLILILTPLVVGLVHHW
jgi:hypothetical protein